MKNLSLLFMAFLFLSVTVLAQNGWNWQNPLPYGNNLQDVCIIDPNTMLAVGDFGLILKTTNGGLNWSKILTEIAADIDQIYFIDPNIGWLCSDGKLYKTTNQGDDWEIILANPQYSCTNFYFINSDTGWVGGNAILATIDGGQSWQVSIDDPSHWQYDEIFFLDNNNGWSIIKNGLNHYIQLIKTTDGGNIWTEINYEPSFLLDQGVCSMHFIDTSTGWIARHTYFDVGGGYLAKTTDGGVNWFIQLQSSNLYGLFDVKFLDENFGFGSGGSPSGGEITQTTNGGADWTTQFLNNSIQLNSIQFLNNDIGCVVGNSGAIFTSEDGGVNWSERSSATTRFDIQSVHFIDKNKGWAVGDTPYEMNYVIINTNNGGGDWNLVLQDTTDRLSSVYFINDLVGFAAGSKIIKTKDAGNSWQTVDSGRTMFDNSMSDIQFINDNIGYAAGDQILKTTNGGDSWELNSNIGAKSIHFTNADTGWAVGKYYPSSIYNTTNGGSAWYVQYSPNDFVLHSVYFVNSEIGWVVGGGSNIGGKILKTTNGGITWDQQITGHSANRFTSVHFEDENSGWVIGNWGGVILRTTNGGTDWTEQKSGANSWLNDIYFVDQSTGWMVGDGGTILHTTNGGVTFVEEEKLDKMPTEFLLSQNFPNPFNPSTKIKYSVPQSSNVVIKVFDVLGNEIETLVKEEKPTGTYELSWSAYNLPSGVYFYRLQAGSFVQTRKMILLK